MVAGLLLFQVSGFCCEVEPVAQQEFGNLKGNAGCLIVEKGAFLQVKNPKKNGTFGWALPGGTSEKGESALCTAYRETLEETGAKVSVGPLLMRFPNKFFLFECTIRERPAKFAPTFTSKLEVFGVAWHKPGEIPADQWRYPNQRPLIEAMVDMLSKRK